MKEYNFSKWGRNDSFMKFIKGIVIGGLITTGIVMMYSESGMMNRKKIMKKGRQVAKKIGIV